MHVPGPAVISQAFPYMHHLVGPGSGQIFQPGEFFQEPVIVGNTLADPGLLKNNFRNPDMVCIASIPPGKVSSVFSYQVCNTLPTFISI